MRRSFLLDGTRREPLSNGIQTDGKLPDRTGKVASAPGKCSDYGRWTTLRHRMVKLSYPGRHFYRKRTERSRLQAKLSTRRVCSCWAVDGRTRVASCLRLKRRLLYVAALCFVLLMCKYIFVEILVERVAIIIKSKEF